MKKPIILLVIFTCITAISTAQTGNTGAFRQEGIASWYGSEFDGKPTASGEIFDSSLLTAAHPSLPFGTTLIVTNKENNRKVTVRVNDRGPFVSARIVDLSKAAAEVLDIITTGTAPVILEMYTTSAMYVETYESPSIVDIAELTEIAPDYLTYWEEAEEPEEYNYWESYSETALEAPEFQEVPEAAPVTASVVTPAVIPATVPTVAPVVTPAVIPPTVPTVAPVVAPVVTPAVIPPTVPTVPTAAAPAATAAGTPPAATPALPAFIPAPPARLIGNMPSATSTKLYRLQIGAYRIPRNATDAFEKLRKAGLTPAYEQSGEYYRVVIARVKAGEIQAILQTLGNTGYREAIIREEN